MRISDWSSDVCSSDLKEDMPFRYSAGARHIFNQFKDKGWDLDKDALPEPGDIVCWWRLSLPSGFGHIGIVHHYKDGFLYKIEGNKAANVDGFSDRKSVVSGTRV